MAEDLLILESIDLERGMRRLLTGVSLTVRPGDCWQMLGSNGSGKTSLMRAMAGLTRLGVQGYRGGTDSVLYQGHLPGLKPLLSCRENLRWHGSGRVTCDGQKIDAALARVGLKGYEDTVICQLSAGQQRRVGLARLWLSEALLWLLDEPFTAIDVDGTGILEAQIQHHCATGGGVVFTSHQPTRMPELKVLDLDQYAA
jgi:heme exporter protein A